jgi:predicted ATPase
MHQGLARFQAIGAEVGRPYFLALLAEVYGRGGQVQEGLSTLDEAQAAMQKTGERWCEAELYRHQGALLLARSTEHDAEAEASFHRALEVARHQLAKSLELRAALNLSRLWQRQGKRAEARQMLAGVYSWFTEGCDTPDLQEAQALLEALA